jgi:hypothetical protein
MAAELENELSYLLGLVMDGIVADFVNSQQGNLFMGGPLIWGYGQ